MIAWKITYHPKSTFGIITQRPVLKNPFPVPVQPVKLENLCQKKAASNAAVDQYCDELTSIIEYAAKSSLKPKIKRKIATNKKKQPVLNNSITRQKEQIISLGRTLQKFPDNFLLCSSYINLKKQLRKNVKRLRAQNKMKILNQITELEDKNPQQFWQLVNKLRSSKQQNSNQCDPDTWFNYFKLLHSNSVNNNYDGKFNEEINKKLKEFSNKTVKQELLDSKITPQELSSALMALKNNKANATDCVTNEIL